VCCAGVAALAAMALTLLGTDGFGRSDARAVLRSFFNVDAESILARALVELGVNVG